MRVVSGAKRPVLHLYPNAVYDVAETEPRKTALPCSKATLCAVAAAVGERWVDSRAVSKPV